MVFIKTKKTTLALAILGATFLSSTSRCEGGSTLRATGKSTLTGFPLEKDEANAVLSAVSTNTKEAIPLEAPIVGTDMDELDSSGMNRRRLTWWDLILFAMDPCHGPDPLHKCKKKSGGGSSSSSSSSSGGGGVSGSSSSEADVGNGSQSFAPKKSIARMALYIVAAAAAVAAMIAMYVGNRKEEKKFHPLQGSVQKRMVLFSEFADSTLCGAVERPDRVVEVNPSMVEGGTSSTNYQMA